MVVVEFFHHGKNSWPLKISAHKRIRILGKKWLSVGNSSFIEEKKMPIVANLSFVEEKWKGFEISPLSKKKIIVLEVCPSWKNKKGLSAGNFSPRA